MNYIQFQNNTNTNFVAVNNQEIILIFPFESVINTCGDIQSISKCGWFKKFECFRVMKSMSTIYFLSGDYTKHICAEPNVEYCKNDKLAF